MNTQFGFLQHQLNDRQTTFSVGSTQRLEGYLIVAVGGVCNLDVDYGRTESAYYRSV